MVRKLDHERAIALRMTGKSYKEIAEDLGVWKSSLSYWLKNLQLPKGAVDILRKKSNYAKDRFAEYNKAKHEQVIIENKEIRENFSKKIKPINNYQMLLIGAALYWAEGQKRHSGKRPNEYVSFSNSDPNMVVIFMRFLREVLRVSDEKINANVQIHTNVSKEKAVSFWSRIVNIPKNRFHTFAQISRASNGKRPKNLLPYGTLNLRVSSRKKFNEIMGLIDGLIKRT